MGNSLMSRNVARGFQKQSLKDLLLDVQEGNDLPPPPRPLIDEVCIPLRRKTAAEFEDDLQEDKVYGLYDIGEAHMSTGEGDQLALTPRATAYVGQAVFRDCLNPGARGNFVGQGYFMYPLLKPNVCLRCSETPDEEFCVTTKFMGGARNIWKRIDIDVEMMKSRRLPLSSFLKFVKAARRADQVYLLSAQHKYASIGSKSTTNVQFMEGVFGLVTFTDRSDVYGNMTFYRYRRNHREAYVSKIYFDMQGLPSRHAMLMKFTT